MNSLEIPVDVMVEERAPLREDAGPASLDGFLAGIERRALVMAEMATHSRDEALDILQDSMLAFVRAYANKPPEEWPALFFRVLQNRIRDWHRRHRVKQRLLQCFHPVAGEPDLLLELPGPAGRRPDELLANDLAAEALVAALQRLPLRQQQVVMLRIWEGLDVAASAQAMGCSTGSVKTHLFRALNRLRTALEDHWGG